MVTHGAAAHDRPLGDRIEVVVRGDIPYQAHRWALGALERLVKHEPWPLNRARVQLTRPPHLVATCRADIQADIGGHLFHTRAEATDARNALDIAVERLRRQAGAVRAGEIAQRQAAARRPQHRGT
jgi:ribosome-associated translation inhibitor RaiA